LLTGEIQHHDGWPVLAGNGGKLLAKWRLCNAILQILEKWLAVDLA
jgi:hypothetical protein